MYSTKLEVGTGPSLFNDIFTHIKIILTPIRITYMWCFMHKYKTLIEDTTPNITIVREHDKFLTREFLNHNVSISCLTHLKRCCVYLRTTTLSNITEGDGSTIRYNIKQGIRSDQAPKKYRWPNQAQTYKRAWTLWRETLNKIFRCTNGELTNGVGNLIDDRIYIRKWYYSPCADIVYHILVNSF